MPVVVESEAVSTFHPASGCSRTSEIINPYILPGNACNQGIWLSREELDARDGLGARQLLVRLILARKSRIIQVVDVQADVVSHSIQSSCQKVLVAKRDRIAFPLVPDREGMHRLHLRLLGIHSHQYSLARSRSYPNVARILLGPVEGRVVGELVADTYLLVADLVFGEVFNLAEAQTITCDINDQEAWIAMGRVRRPADRSLHDTY
jgi:hypothetical protein